MGLVGMLKEGLSGMLGAGKKPVLEGKCPKCKAKINTSMERCPGCGTRISSMFSIECPKCKEKNEVNASACKKCGFSFLEKKEPAAKQYYRCPRCGYKADFYMLRCPACGVKFA